MTSTASIGTSTTVVNYRDPNSYTIHVFKDKAGDFECLVAIVDELPGCVAQGDTLPEVVLSLAGAIELYLSVDEETT
jgi:predicted RNase H-like HicB family nuclease